MTDNHLRIAIVGTRGIPANYGGFETFAEEMSKGLVEKGHVVTVYCENQQVKLAELNGVKLKYVPLKKSTNQAFYFLISFWMSLRNNDVIIVTSTGASYYYFLNKLFFNRLIITNTDGVESRRAKWNVFEKMYLLYSEFFAVKKSHAGVADSRGSADYLYSHYKKMAPLAVIEYGAQVIEDADDSFKSLGLVANGYLLIVARLEPENNLLMMIEGYKMLKTDMPLIIVGNLQSTGYVQRLKEFESENVRFVGGIYEKTLLNSVRKNAFAYLHGHSVGGTNPSLLEAMGAGNICICHDNIYNREVTANRMFYFSDVTQVAHEIQQLQAMSPTELGQFRQVAVGRISSYYNWNNMLDKYLALISKMSGLKYT